MSPGPDTSSSPSNALAASRNNAGASLPRLRRKTIWARSRAAWARCRSSSGPRLGDGEQFVGGTRRGRLELGLGSSQCPCGTPGRIRCQLRGPFEKRGRRGDATAGLAPGPPIARTRRRPAPRGPPPRRPDATLDDRDRRPDRSPPPARDVLAVGQAVMPPGKQRRARGDDGNAPGLRTRSAPKPWPGARHRRRSRAARMRAAARRRRRPVRLPRSAAAVASRPGATEAAGGSSVRGGSRAAACRDDRTRRPAPPRSIRESAPPTRAGSPASRR